ncbi:MAG: hypothetical protein CMQ14_08955 [Gammaproteobacteria bacterium]|nr:hypothetical protein [Gammaproteobacteria bacterium]|tara:strand:+ start:1390 stop:1764 length:375 start_codon:yes stop_codon:yes gene_type:complete
MSILPFSTGEERKLRDAIAQYVFEMEYANCIELDSNLDPKEIAKFAWDASDQFMAARKRPQLVLASNDNTTRQAPGFLKPDLLSPRWAEFAANPEKFALDDDGEPKLNAQGDPQYKRGRPRNTA